MRNKTRSEEMRKRLETENMAQEDDRGSKVRFPTGARNFSLQHRVQTISGAHPAS